MARKPTQNTPAPEDPADASAAVTAPAPETGRPTEGASDAGDGSGSSPGGSVPLGGPLHLTVIGPAKGRWRAGRRFGPEPVVIPVADLSEAQLAAIQADPELVTIVD